MALGIRYALTGELPVNWIPSLLVDIILEAAAYSAFSSATSPPDFIWDLLIIQETAKPWTEGFAKVPEQIKRGLYDYHWVRQIARTGPYLTACNDLAITYRHRPWNNYFRKKSLTPEDVLSQPRRNIEGNPEFHFGRLQRGIVRTLDQSGRNVISVVRGGIIRRTVREEVYIAEESTGANYGQKPARNPTEI